MFQTGAGKPAKRTFNSKAAGLYMISLSKHAAERKGFQDALCLMPVVLPKQPVPIFSS